MMEPDRDRFAEFMQIKVLDDWERTTVGINNLFQIAALGHRKWS